ncbi:MAG: hypothetical protein IKN04_09145 [Clostridia bacterium]|nr:hypothetical protein [Clostridia bacterium]
MAARVTASRRRGDHLGQLPGGGITWASFPAEDGRRGGVDRGGAAAGLPLPGGQGGGFPPIARDMGKGEGLESKAAQGFQGDHRRREKIFLKKK